MLPTPTTLHAACHSRLSNVQEAAYCDPGLVSEVVVPLLSMQSSVLLCISTILDSGNHYTKMMELVDDFGKTVFETIKITLVCGTWYLHTIVFW
jgi:hypothetical protein